MCSSCQCECELEVPVPGAIVDQELVKRKEKEEQDARRNVLHAIEIRQEDTKNVFQKSGGDSEPKNLSKMFRDFEASEKWRIKR